MNASDREWEMDGAYDWRRIVEPDSARKSWARSFDQRLVNFIAAVPDSAVLLAHELDLRSAQWMPQVDSQSEYWVTSHRQDWSTLETGALPPNFGNPGAMVLRVQDLSLIHLGRDVDAEAAQQALAYTFSHSILRSDGGDYEIWALERSATRDAPDLLAAIALEDIGATVREAPAPVVDLANRLDLEHADWIGVPDPKAGPFSFVDDPAHVDGFAAVQARIQDEAQRQCAVTLTEPQARAVMQYAHGVQLSAAQPTEWPIGAPPSQQIGDWAEHEHTRRVEAITEAQTMQRRVDLHTAIDAAALAREVRELTPDYPRPAPNLVRGPDTASPNPEPTALVPPAEPVWRTPETATPHTHEHHELPDLDTTKFHTHWSAESDHLSAGHQMWQPPEFHHRGPSL
ncbi:hypothetical protein [Rhodococcus sp. APC 3903]|uniref:hypothetical protein n=1 Tax=Rhodococcus sp. APC 3903 TaxID=3035193 RepID=UPI0025B5C16E|nr:hypothetical protein [Rhodococcus sp. APC 3903]MDN3460521.1 hypothetical protein [Rhodococcus sp. APC 3903]